MINNLDLRNFIDSKIAAILLYNKHGQVININITMET